MKGRVKGGCTKRPDLYEGLEIGFENFAEFRAWAISTGFRKGLSPDRIDPMQGYTPDNLRWVSIEHNRMRALSDAGYMPEYESPEDPWGLGATTIYPVGDEVPF